MKKLLIAISLISTMLISWQTAANAEELSAQWIFTDWQTCAADQENCQEGDQIRVAECRINLFTVVEDGQCNGNKPIISRQNGGNTTFNLLHYWIFMAWSECQNNQQSREAVCRYNLFSAADESMCLGARPTMIRSCETEQAADCALDDIVVADGENHAFYQSDSVPYGESCDDIIQTRSCDNGTLSGDDDFNKASCEVEAAADCTIGEQTVTHGSGVEAWQASSVSYGETCQSEDRMCNNGVLSGSYTFSSCEVAPANACVLDGTTVANESSHTFYQSNSVPHGESCDDIAQSRTCDNGTLSGDDDFNKASCEVEAAAESCVLDGVTVNSGDTHAFYQSDSVPYGESCDDIIQTRSCDNGTLSGDDDFNKASCEVEAAADCTIGEQTVTHGSGVEAWQASSVSYGETCQSEDRMCNNGVLSGSYTFSSCEVAPADACVLDGATVANESSHTFYQSNSVPYGESCDDIAQSRTCDNGSLSGDDDFNKASCEVEANNSCVLDTGVVDTCEVE